MQLSVHPDQVLAAFLALESICRAYDVPVPPKIARGMRCSSNNQCTNSFIVVELVAPNAHPCTDNASVLSIKGSELSDELSVATTEAIDNATGEAVERARSPPPLDPSSIPVAAKGPSMEYSVKAYTCTHCGTYNEPGQRLKWHVVVVGRRPGIYSPEEVYVASPTLSESLTDNCQYRWCGHCPVRRHIQRFLQVFWSL